MKRLVEIFVPTTPEAIVFDPFAGSGTTLVAAKLAKLNYFGIEIEERYIDIIKARLKSANAQPENLLLDL